MYTTLFAIDCQRDFMDIPGAALPVTGAVVDMARVCRLLETHPEKINKIVKPLDQHPLNHIGHASEWVNGAGEHPAWFATIRHSDAQNFHWMTAKPWLHYQITDYLAQLEQAGKFHTIWPPHCIIGTHGACIYEPLLYAIEQWRSGDMNREVHFFPKSGYWGSEQYSSFKCEVVIPDEPSTAFNKRMMQEISIGNILIVGEALGHCVAATVMDAIETMPDIAKRMSLLRDCTSPVAGSEAAADAFLAKFVEAGGTVTTSTEVFA